MALAAPAGATLTLEPPPGWEDASRKAPGAAIALKGPQTSSFVVKAKRGIPLDNAAGVRGYLTRALAGAGAATGRKYTTSGRVETKTFRNGLVVHLLRGELDGEPRVVLGAFEAEGSPYLAMLVSAAPEAMLATLFGAIEHAARPGAMLTSGAARSLDGQLAVALGGGLRARSLTPEERSQGFQLAIQGSGSELLFQKLEAEDAKPAEQAAIARELAARTAGAAKDAVSPAREAPTAAGPVAAFASAPAAGAEGRVAVGFLPWAFWGYQLYARGPAAEDLLAGVMAAIRLGPGADAALVGRTPRVPLDGSRHEGRGRFYAAAGAAALLLFAGAWSLLRKKG